MKKMKKIVLFLVAAIASVSSFAENTLNVVPFTVSETASGSSGYFYISMSNDDCAVQALSFDLYFPTGMRVYTNNSGNLISSSMALVSDRSTYYNEDEEDNVTAFASASGHNFKTDTEGVEYYNWQGAGEWAVAGTSGNLFKGRYKLSADMTAGVYPVVVKAALRNLDGVGDVDVVTTSYVIVGDGGDGSLTLSNELPSWALEALNSDATVKNLDLSAVTAINGSMTLAEGRTITAPTASGVTVPTLTYSLTGASESSMKTLCFPYDVTVDAGKAYVTTSNIENGYVHFDEATTIPANTCAIVTGDISYSATDATLVDVTGKSVAAGDYYLASTKFKKASAAFTAPVYRAAWSFTGGEVKGFILDGADGIKTVELNEVDGADIYDLSGRKLNKATKGINIIGGEKVLRK